DQTVEGGKQLERHQERPALEELPVVHALLRRERVLQLPREPDARVVVRAARPARVGASHHRFPEARHTVGEAIERRAEPDLLHEAERRALAPDAARREAAERAVDRKSTRLNSSHVSISYAVFCLK